MISSKTKKMSETAETRKSDQSLQFAPFASSLDGGFWHKLSKNKLDVYGLDEKPRNLHGFYNNSDPHGLPCRMNLDFTAFEENYKSPPRCYRTNGIILNTNRLDTFKGLDKKALINKAGCELWEDIKSGNAIQDPSLLAKFLLITFADLKKYHYYFWFAFPALSTEPAVTVSENCTILQKYSQEQVSQFLLAYDSFRENCSDGFFLIQFLEDGVHIGRLTDYSELSKSDKKITLGVCDPCVLEKHPGWPLRNFLSLAAYHWFKSEETIDVVCLRDRVKKGEREVSHSLVLTVKLPSLSQLTECPNCVGWEKNEKQKLAPRHVNLSSSLDPTKLAESSVDLNLKLMRWRLMPELDLETISRTKCLLLGSGTLGCNIARNLMGWGVRTITLVDYGRISYSNPIRQSLFVFEDSLDGGKPKAQAAAEAMKRIFPGVNATGVTLSIPMPGHSVPEIAVEQVRQDVCHLEQLVDDHDVIFLLLDTREARWLPTVLGAAKRKIVINAALGFDTFLVLRHGLKTAGGAVEPVTSTEMMRAPIPGDQLGCYFCNDVVAPGDSTQDRTLDQQCTVSRPGMSMMTAALAVELLVSLLQHPDGGRACADTSAKDEHLTKELACSLGLVPHQIRGFLSRFHNVLPACRAFDKCTACSQIVIENYLKEGFDFLLRAFNDPKYLEDLTGLSKLHQDTDSAEVWTLSSDEEY